MQHRANEQSERSVTGYLSTVILMLNDAQNKALGAFLTAGIPLVTALSLVMEGTTPQSLPAELSRANRAVSKVLKRKGTPDPKMAKALRKANQIGRKKNGGYKKGYSQAKIMSKAHQLRRKM